MRPRFMLVGGVKISRLRKNRTRSQTQEAGQSDSPAFDFLGTGEV
jgi:hypothetical protein